MAWRQGVGFFSNRTIAQHTRKPMDAGKNRVVKILTNIVWFLLYKLTAKFAEKLFFGNSNSNKPRFLSGCPIYNDISWLSARPQYARMPRQCSISGLLYRSALSTCKANSYSFYRLHFYLFFSAGFNYEIIIGHKAGSRQSDGSWDGMIGDLLSGKADMIVASLTINQVKIIIFKILLKNGKSYNEKRHPLLYRSD